MIGYRTTSGPGHPDTGSGRGYGNIAATGNRSRPVGMPGYPYDIDDVGSVDDFDEELTDEVDRIASSTRAGYMPHDAFAMHRRDRRKFVSADVQLGPIESSLIRLRPNTSEPDPGTTYGWSRPPIWDEPRRLGGVDRPRYGDVTRHSPESDLEDQLDILDVELVREYVNCILLGL